jgi:hypothetical protein
MPEVPYRKLSFLHLLPVLVKLVVVNTASRFDSVHPLC